MTGPDPLPWLLEAANPSARYLALTDLLDHPADDPEVVAARSAIPGWGPAQAILDAQWPEGYWMHPGVGYSPKYTATVWQVIFLAALGTPCTKTIEQACAYVLEHSRLPDGRFTAHKTPRGAVACLNGNLLGAMFQLGYQDPRLEESLEVVAERVVRDGFRCRFNAPSPKPARMDEGLPCAWGAIKVLGAFARVPEEQRSPAAKAAITAGMSFLFSADLQSGDYPTATGPSPLWHKFGFPLGYTSDLLEALEVLGQVGANRELCLTAAVETVQSKQDAAGRWLLDYSLGNTWADFGRVAQPSKWVTLRALRSLRRYTARA